MPTGNSVCIPLPIKTMRKNSNSIVGCKNHVLVDCISGLPIYEITTTAEAADSSVVLDILADTHRFLPLTECTFLADKGCDVKNIYNQISCLYNGECIIPLNKRNTKNPKLLPQGNPVCEAGLSMWKDRKFSKNRHTRQKFCCPLKNSKNEVCSCHHKNFYNGKKHRGCTKYITVPNDLRLSIDRVSQYFKSRYKECLSLSGKSGNMKRLFRVKLAPFFKARKLRHACQNLLSLLKKSHAVISQYQSVAAVIKQGNPRFLFQRSDDAAYRRD